MMRFEEENTIADDLFMEFMRENNGEHSSMHRHALESLSQTERVELAKKFIMNHHIVNRFMNRVTALFPTSKPPIPILDQIIKDAGYELPADPEKAYAGKGWNGWDDFLGTKGNK